jgi:hypothetical protein
MSGRFAFTVAVRGATPCSPAKAGAQTPDSDWTPAFTGERKDQANLRA